MQIWLKGAVAGAALIATAASASAQMVVRAGDTVTVTGPQSELVLVAGDEITLNVQASDDVAAAGGDISARGASFAHLFAAGGEISFTQSTAGDLFASGGEIDVLSGEVTDDLIAAGGRITLGPEARIGGDVVMAGGRLRIEAPVGGGVRAAGGAVTIAGPVTGDVYIDADSIVIAPDAHIMGAFTHRGRDVEIAPEARIDGQVTALQPRPEINFKPLAIFGIWVASAILFGLFLMAIAVAAWFPRLMNDTASALRTQPLLMLAIGAVLAVIAPVVIVLLMVTLIGIPLAFLLAVVMTLLWPLSIVGVAYTLGMLARSRTRADAPAPHMGARVLWGGVGMIVLILVGFIPWLGFLAWLVAYVFGIGAVASQGWRALSRETAAA